MKTGDDIRREEWLEELRRHDMRSDLRDALFAFLIAAICFGSLWASAADGGVDRPVIDVHHGRVTASDGGVFDVTGGAWLSDAVVIDRASELVATQAELDRLKATPPRVVTPVLVITNILTGLIQTAGVVMVTCVATTGSAICAK